MTIEFNTQFKNDWNPILNSFMYQEKYENLVKDSFYRDNEHDKHDLSSLSIHIADYQKIGF